jgi:endonuclease/exonuclease/phosphatase family metal-dependent hydrolase
MKIRPGRSREAALALCGVLCVALAGCRVLQYNIGNGADPARHGEQDIIEMLDRGERPTVITLNEVCGLRYNQIRHMALGLGYSSDFLATNPGGCGASGAGLGYGNAIFVHGPFLNPTARFFYDTQRAGSNEDRGIMCVSFNPAGLGGRAMACVTHLDNHAGIAAAQSAEALAFASFLWVAGGRPWAVVGGDFNLEPGHAAITAWRTSAFKLVSNALAPTHENGKTIDYLFATHTQLFPNNFTRIGRSDHRMVFADIWE